MRWDSIFIKVVTYFLQYFDPNGMAVNFLERKALKVHLTFFRNGEKLAFPGVNLMMTVTAYNRRDHSQILQKLLDDMLQ